MIIDCGSCAVAGPACGDCVVTVLLGMPGAPAAPEVPDTHAPALAVLAESGLVPPLRLVRGDGRPGERGGQPGSARAV